ncbi:MAG: EAL and GGDEF domain-containing protein [Desulfovibrio sp.]|jgi:EAL domain-containing protein (putative c-di-GMP-specific phosphodiesterase class I)/GGDEF domain-containing protein/CBS domain-containing protein|nr:EAL and GGDEF domain-containing protein [Desulfovibrio sp.]
MDIRTVLSIIENRQIKTVFQPIISLRDGKVLGYEALSRVSGENSHITPDVLFNAAQKYNLLLDLEYLSRTIAIMNASEKILKNNSNSKVFINVSTIAMQDNCFRTGFTKNMLNSLNIEEKNIIFEITEKHATDNIYMFKTLINHYKDQNFQIAIDDLGSGYSGLNLISEISPHYVKLDMNLIRGINNNRLKQGLIRGIVEFSNIASILLIAEGIESQEELETIVNLGVQYGQGYYIQMPREDIIEVDAIFLKVLRGINIRKNNFQARRLSDIYIKNLCAQIHIASPHEQIRDIHATYANKPDFTGLCVLSGGVPVGIVTRENLFRILGGQFGFSLHNRKLITEIMDREFLAVDEKEPVNIVAGFAMSRPRDKLYDFIVVTSDQHYRGIVTIKNLLIKATEVEIFTAKHQNPLTGLPGNVFIEKELSACISGASKFSVAYIDLDNFKAYNDIYGFERGDCVLKLLADKLQELVSDVCFIGHVGGDDFVAIVYGHVTEEYFADALDKFSSEVLYFYNNDDIRNGYITAHGRDNKVRRFPLLSVTCVIVDNKRCSYAGIHDLSETLARLKKSAKASKLTRYRGERRRRGEAPPQPFFSEIAADAP